MNAGKLIFSQLTDWIHPEQFRRCVNRYAGNYKVYNFPCWDQFLAMAFAQITYRESLADIEVCLRSRPDQLYRMGFRSTVAHSTLADANSARDWRNPGRTALITAGFLPTELEARLRLALP